MLGQAFSYTPSISLGGIPSTAPQRLAGMTTDGMRTTQQQSFNAPAYMRARQTPGMWDEMNRKTNDQHLAGLLQQKTQMGRQMGAQNAQAAFGQMGAASQAAGNFYDTMAGYPWLSQSFGGYGGMTF